jgi:endonuclease/exonuclease/phosphatase family metal-dependent hydrolase
MERAAILRVMTYNVHRCVGCDGKLSPARVARLIAAHEPDVVALQELDVARARTARGDQPLLIAEQLRMRYHFHPAIQVEEERYGDAVLSRLPMSLVRAGPLPTLPHRPRLERRGALWVRIDWDGRAIDCFNTHLGLGVRERRRQVEALLGPDWLAHPERAGPVLLCGDFNASPWSGAYRRLRRALRDAQDRRGAAPRGTFPSRWPVLRIDHVFHSPDLVIRRAQVPRTRLARMASDHLPLIVEVSLR